MYLIPAFMQWKPPHRQRQLSAGTLGQGCAAAAKDVFHVLPLALTDTEAGGLAPACAALALDLGGYGIDPKRRLGQSQLYR